MASHAYASSFTLSPRVDEPNQTDPDLIPSRSGPFFLPSCHGLSTVCDSYANTSGAFDMTSPNRVRQRPAAIHEDYPYSASSEYSIWGRSSSISDQLSPCAAHPTTFYPPVSAAHDTWEPLHDSCDFIDIDSSIDQAYTTDEAVPILDLQYMSQQPGAATSVSDPISLDFHHDLRRMSGSSHSVSTLGAFSEIPYEDSSAAWSEAPSSYCSDLQPYTSHRSSLISLSTLSPIPSPSLAPQSRFEMTRTANRGHACASPRPGRRSAPYSVESLRDTRWSTGSYAPLPNRRPSSNVHQNGAVGLASQNSYKCSNAVAYNRNSMFLPSQLPSGDRGFYETIDLPRPTPRLSNVMLRMLQKNDGHSIQTPNHHHRSHYTDLSEPPDLYGSLLQEQLPPPDEDISSENPDLIPREQELRFEGDMYTPRWVRGHGNKREGWCGICKPGRWLVLKNSAFWYDKSFTHGVSAATGQRLAEPKETRRMDANPEIWEGQCPSCDEWVALVSSKKKGTTWFRHAYKCYSHSKVKNTQRVRAPGTYRAATY